MNHDEAKTTLLLYRPGPTDADDPQIAEALTVATRDPELVDWLKKHCARQDALRAKFRQITVPAGLKEQIISEQAAHERISRRRRNALFAVAAAVVALIALAPLWFPHQPRNDTFANYRSQMGHVALFAYGMDLTTNNPAAVRAYLAQNQAPSDYVLTAPLEKTALIGCAIQNWRGAKVSMLCFRTGRPLPPGEQSDLWLFVIDRSRVADAPPPGSREFVQVSRLRMVTWTEGDKLYVLGTADDEQTLRQYL